MHNANIVIRPLEHTDAVQLRQNCFPINTLEEIQSQIATSLQAFAEGKVVPLVAEADGKVVGSITLQRHLHRLRMHRAEVGGLVVHSPYQGQGIARRLLDECRRWAQSMGIQILELSCRGGEPAEQVYRNLGFQEYGRLPRGLIEPTPEHNIFDEVYFYQMIHGTE